MADLTDGRRMGARALLDEISHCSEVPRAAQHPDHPCAVVVGVQAGLPLAERQVPEPWTGHLSDAVVLFISSNPSISEAEEYPDWSAPAEDVREHFSDRFRGGPGQVKDGVYGPLRDGGWAKATSYWAHVKKRAAEVVEDPHPGWDYALTEVVHCKSRSEIGVPQARNRCTERYLARVVAAAPWSVVLVVYGGKARDSFNDTFGSTLSGDNRYQQVQVDGLARHVVHLDHPASGGKVKRMSTAVDPRVLQEICDEVRAFRCHRSRSNAAARQFLETCTTYPALETVFARRGATWVRWSWADGVLYEAGAHDTAAEGSWNDAVVPPAPAGSPAETIHWLVREGWSLVQHSKSTTTGR